MLSCGNLFGIYVMGQKEQASELVSLTYAQHLESFIFMSIGTKN